MIEWPTCACCRRPFVPRPADAVYCGARCTGRAANRGFMMGVGRIKRRTEQHDIYTRPLFPLWLILGADGTLAEGVRDLAQRYQA